MIEMSELETMLRNADAAGDTEAAKLIVAEMDKIDQSQSAQQPGTLADLGNKLAQRGKDIGQSVDRYKSQIKNMPLTSNGEQGIAPLAELALQVGGDVAGAIGTDIIGTGVAKLLNGAKYIYNNSYISDVLPDAVKEGVSKIKLAALDNPVTNAGLEALKYGQEAWIPWKEKNPNEAKNIESVLNIGMLIGPKGVFGSAAKQGEKSVLGGAADVLTLSATQEKSKIRNNFLHDLIYPSSTAEKNAAQLQAAKEGRRVEVNGERSFLPSNEQKEIVKVINNVPDINAGNSATVNNNNLLKAIGVEGQSLEKQLASSEVKIRGFALSSDLESAKQQVLSKLGIKPGSNVQLEAYVDNANEIMKRLYAEERSKGVSDSVAMLNARKGFDSEVKKIAGQYAYESPENKILIQSAKTVRNATNELLINANPDVGIRQSLNIQHRLFQAGDETAVKAAKEANSGLESLINTIDKAMPIKYRTAATLGVVGAATIASPLLVVGTGGYGVYLAGKALTGPAAKETLAKTLMLADKAIQTTKNAKTIIALQTGKQQVQQIMDGLDQQESSNPNAVQSQLPSGQPAVASPTPLIMRPPVTPPLPGPVAQSTPQDMPFNALQNGPGIAAVLRPQQAYRQAMTGIGGR